MRHHGITDTNPDFTSSFETRETVANNEDDVSEEIVTSPPTDKCGYCEQDFDDVSELNSHMLQMHSLQEMIVPSD